MEQTSESSTSRWKWLALLALLLVVGWLGYRWLNPPYVPPVQPEINAYNTLVSLGRKLARRTGFYSEMPDAELTQVVAANESILQDAREALRKESVVALDWQADQQWFGDAHLKHIDNLRNLSRGFAAEGLIAVKRGDAREAINCGLENLLLGEAAARGGLGTDFLVGIAVRTLGLITLRDACDIATLTDCDHLLRRLPDVSKQMEPPAEITKREWHFFRRINGPWTTFLMEMTFANNRADFEKRMEGSRRVLETRANLLRLHYAIRAFELENDRLPKSLVELGGRILAELAGDDFVYQVSADKYLLYHVGLNGVDDGGVEKSGDPSQGDVLLEAQKGPSFEPAAVE